MNIKIKKFDEFYKSKYEKYIKNKNNKNWHIFHEEFSKVKEIKEQLEKISHQIDFDINSEKIYNVYTITMQDYNKLYNILEKLPNAKIEISSVDTFFIRTK